MYTINNPLIFDETILEKIHGIYPNDKKIELVDKQIAVDLLFFTKMFEDYILTTNKPVDKYFKASLRRVIDNAEKTN